MDLLREYYKIRKQLSLWGGGGGEGREGKGGRGREGGEGREDGGGLSDNKFKKKLIN